MNELIEREKEVLSPYDFQALIWEMHKNDDLDTATYLELAEDI